MKKNINVVRETIKWGFLSLITGLSLTHIYGNKAIWAPLDAYCPFGSLESGWKLITQGGYLEKIQPSNLALLIALIITTLLFGGIFCGWICPLGTLQDGLNRLGRKFKFPQINIPTKWDTALRWLRLPFLGLVLFQSYSLIKLWFVNYDPFRLIFGLHWFSEPEKIGVSGWVIMALFFVFSLFSSRFWCKYLCPFGFVVEVLSKLSWLRIRWSPSDCTKCNLCSRNCPLGLEVPQHKLHSTSCNHCLQCVAVCPNPKALEYKNNFAHTTWLGVGGVSVFVLVILAAQVMGWWNPKIGSDPESIKGWMTLGYLSQTYHIPLAELKTILQLPEKASGLDELRSFEDQVPDFSMDQIRKSIAQRSGSTSPNHSESNQNKSNSAVSHQTQANNNASTKPATANTVIRDPEEIKGKMSLKEVSETWRIPISTLATQLGLPANVDTQLPIHELEAPYGVGGAKVREAVKKVLALP